MPKEKQQPTLSVISLRHAEYYGMQPIFDDLYARSVKQEKFDNLMEIILSEPNILLAYRNIKTNTGSKTPGTDGLNIKDIGCLTANEVIDKVRYIVTGSDHGYRPKPVRRKDIPKPYDPSKTRPLGIPCMWDRLIQQCIKQVLEPICEAKFSDNSYGFRPNRSVEHAIQKTYKLMQVSKLHHVVEFDIKGFFDNVNHSKLLKQIWAMGIRDKHLLYILKQILKAPIKMPDGTMHHPTKGTPQGGIISPLLANVVLNELDHWVESQWQENPITQKYCHERNGRKDHSAGYLAMKKTRLKEMFIVRYADDFRIFCRTKTAAVRTRIAISQWLTERLGLEVSEEKTRVVNTKRRATDFLGFKIKVNPKSDKYVVSSHISDKQLKRQRQALVEQAKKVARPRPQCGEAGEIRLYNQKVLGIQEYYSLATNINVDCAILGRAVDTVFTNRLRTQTAQRFVRTGRPLTKFEQAKYGESAMLRFVAGTEEPIYPIGYVKHRKPMAKKQSICSYTPEGRKHLHDNLRINTRLMRGLMRAPTYGNTIEYADNRISIFSAQWGRCAITGREFETVAEIHCHHKVPKRLGGNDSYDNLILVMDPVHKLIHASNRNTIERYMEILQLDDKQLAKVNKLRALAKLEEI